MKISTENFKVKRSKNPHNAPFITFTGDSFKNIPFSVRVSRLNPYLRLLCYALLSRKLLWEFGALRRLLCRQSVCKAELLSSRAAAPEPPRQRMKSSREAPQS